MVGKNFSNFISLLVLGAGLVAGLALIRTSQDIRREAGQEDKVTICHKTGADKYQKIEIAPQAVQSHLDHGDMLTGCDDPAPEEPQQPEDPAPEPTEDTSDDTQTGSSDDTNNTDNQSNNDQSNNESEDNNDSDSGTTVNNTTNNVTNNIVNNNSSDSDETNENVGQTILDNQADLPDTFAPSSEPQNQFNFTLKLEHINNSVGKRNVTLIFQKSGTISAIRNLSMSSGSDGIFTGTAKGIEAGVYRVVVKPDGYLSRVFSVDVVSGKTDWNWTSSTFLVGDFNNDNMINILDYGLMLSEYTDEEVKVNKFNAVYDVNGDGVYNATDIDLALNNFGQLSASGEEL